jgi:peroxiredoxin
MAISTPVAVEEAVDRKETLAADGGAHRFVLPSALGEQVSLQDFLDRGNVILVFYRAFW